MSGDDQPPSDDDDYKVGYGRPPKEHRFKPGRSGNPRGRPKKSQNVGTILRRVLERRFSVRDGGRHRRLSKLELIVEGQANKAAKGDVRSLALLLPIIERLGLLSDDVSPQDVLSVQEAELLRAFMDRISGPGSAGSNDGPT